MRILAATAALVDEVMGGITIYDRCDQPFRASRAVHTEDGEEGLE